MDLEPVGTGAMEGHGINPRGKRVVVEGRAAGVGG